MGATFVASARRSGAVDEFRRFAAHPANKVLDFRVFSERLGCPVIVCEIAFAEGPVQHAVADDMDVTRAIAAFRFRNPVMPVDARSVDHLPPANGTGAERLCGASLAGHGSGVKRCRIPGTAACSSRRRRAARSVSPHPIRCGVSKRSRRHRRGSLRSAAGSGWSLNG